MVSVSRKKTDLACKANSIKKSLEASLNREPTVGEISKELNIAENIIMEAWCATQKPTSLYTVVGDPFGSNEIFLLDTIDNGTFNIDNLVDNIALKDAIKRLSNEEKELLYHRYVLEKTQKRIAEKMDCSQMTICRFEQKILNKLKNHIKY
jgi:RNA polymerase sporulation-specific sigma factor